MTLNKTSGLLLAIALTVTVVACDGKDGSAQDMAQQVADLKSSADMAPSNTVMVGQGGLTFSPQTLTIPVGATVTWIWASSGHNVVSGTGGTADNKFCSPNDTSCASTPTSNAGTMYSRTFTSAGSFPYFCKPHVLSGMTGTIIVQ